MTKIDVSCLIQNFYDTNINNNTNNRFRSWEHCHNVFVSVHKKGFHNLSEDDKNILTLHLSFCLASFGMYRGSSFLLNMDYLANRRVVDLIFEPMYEPLWEFDPSYGNIQLAKHLIFDKTIGIYNRIKKECYSDVESSIIHEEKSTLKKEVLKKPIPTDILITKILMITFCCMPGFDTFVKKVTTSTSEKSFVRLCESVNKHREQFVCQSKTIYYPPMRCLDILLWCFGFVLCLTDKNNLSSKEKLSEIVRLNILPPSFIKPSFNSTSNDISRLIKYFNFKESKK